jgi:hypothetical protein
MNNPFTYVICNGVLVLSLSVQPIIPALNPDNADEPPHAPEDPPAKVGTPAYQIPASGAVSAPGAAATGLPLGWIPGYLP